ncbi:MAG: helix-turn-helix transcriptional regulator [Rhodoplanes sp.]
MPATPSCRRPARCSTPEKARNARRLSQEALAFEAGVDRTYVSALERGVYNATIVMVAKLAKALGLNRANSFKEGQGREPGNGGPLYEFV